MLKKIVLRLGICIAVLVAIVWYSFFDTNNLPEGAFIASYPSPAATHVVNVFKCTGNATVADSLRAEVVTGNTVRNIYWKYDESLHSVEWISEDVVSINGTQLNVRRDVYDWRH